MNKSKRYIIYFLSSLLFISAVIAKPSLAQEPTPTPTPIPTLTPTPAPTSVPKLTCFVSAYSYGMNVTATVTTRNSQGVPYYYFNFNDGGGDRNYTSDTNTHLYSKEGTYTTSAYVIDVMGQSDRCNSESYVIKALTPTPTPTPCCRVILTAAQLQDPPRELPKTGLPFAAWALLGLVPAGIGLRKFKSIAPKGNIARFLWEKRKFLKIDS